MNKQDKIERIEKALEILVQSYDLDDINDDWCKRLFQGTGEVRIALSLLKKGK